MKPWNNRHYGFKLWRFTFYAGGAWYEFDFGKYGVVFVRRHFKGTYHSGSKFIHYEKF